MKGFMAKVILLIITALCAFIYYYIALPAFNIHSNGFWIFLISLLAILLFFYALHKWKKSGTLEHSKGFGFGIGLITLTIIVYLIGSLLSSPIVNAKKYQSLLTVETGDFTKDIKQINFNQIPLLDKDSAALLGNRKMGSMVDMVSQFEVSDLYTQINYQGKPVRVSPLKYASPIKWLTNQSSGIPAYILIDMATQNTECVKLTEGIKYSQTELFNRNIYRHLRFAYPTYIFDSINFEIDEEGTPYWICPVKQFNIGLFGGQTIGKVVLCNAITGETTVYAIEDVPTWVDRVYSANLLTNLYNYYGTLKHGYLNSILSQKDCLQTTNGYNYIALNDDVWVYTGVTSVSGDQSNVGFVLMNQRTMETRFFAVEGAIEDSAMASAEGQVQNLGYRASFPLLLNIANEPTYFITLKDAAGLVKKYAMVNVQRYQLVAIGDTVSACETIYKDLLSSNGLALEEVIETQEVTGTIKKLVPCVIDGNTHYLLQLLGHTEIYDIILKDHFNMINYDIGDTIHFLYTPGEDTNRIVTIMDAKKNITTDTTEDPNSDNTTTKDSTNINMTTESISMS